jgi:hypothetical protein
MGDGIMEMMEQSKRVVRIILNNSELFRIIQELREY